MYEQGGYAMGEIKTDLFPDRLRAARDRERGNIKGKPLRGSDIPRFQEPDRDQTENKEE